MQQNITIILVVGGLILFAFYLATGSDPLGLFSDGESGLQSTGTLIDDVGGEWWNVYFTDPVRVNDPENLAGSIPEKLIEYIDNANASIHIASFEFDLTPVAEALISAHQRGVEVLWVTDDENGIEADEEEGHGQFELMEKAGIEIKDDARSGLMHNKFWIFDNQVVWTGSTNITQNGNFRNNNNVIVITSPRLAGIYEREFDEMWAGEFGVTSPSTVNQQALTLNGTPIQVLFAAEDDVADRLVELLETAEKSIHFMAFSFTHELIGETILSKSTDGVEVMGIFETRGSETEFSRLPVFYCAGLDVRQDGNPGTFHHKVFVIDQRVVVTGSYNFSNNADQSNDENVIIIENSDIADRYLQEFDRRWSEAAEPDRADMDCR